ncbi:hypothetical protein WKK05_41790 (plasmid) [Nostoc sp. UHCC 0302]|uniref:hypothetical protein n=1 Tax=Nostoc sp. UHCC 0302 TaxID=3134896 RepID=UPI00311CB7C5
MSRTTLRNTLAGIGATAAALALGYFGVQYLGRNTMYTIAAAVGGAGAISYVLQKPSQPEAPATPVKTQRRRNKS